MLGLNLYHQGVNHRKVSTPTAIHIFVARVAVFSCVEAMASSAKNPCEKITQNLRLTMRSQ